MSSGECRSNANPHIFWATGSGTQWLVDAPHLPMWWKICPTHWCSMGTLIAHRGLWPFCRSCDMVCWFCDSLWLQWSTRRVRSDQGYPISWTFRQLPENKNLLSCMYVGLFYWGSPRGNGEGSNSELGCAPFDRWLRFAFLKWVFGEELSFQNKGHDEEHFWTATKHQSLTTIGEITNW